MSICKCNTKAWIFTSITTIFLIQPDRPSVHAKCVTNWQEFVRGDQFTYERGREEDTRQARRKIRRSSGHAYVQILCTPSLRSLEYQVILKILPRCLLQSQCFAQAKVIIHKLHGEVFLVKVNSKGQIV